MGVERQSKREKGEEDEEEMEIDDDEEGGKPGLSLTIYSSTYPFTESKQPHLSYLPKHNRHRHG